MASGISQQLIYVQSPECNRQSFRSSTIHLSNIKTSSSTVKRNHNFSIRLRAIPESSSPTKTTDFPPEPEPEPPIPPKPIKISSNSNLPSTSSFLNSLSPLFRRLRDEFVIGQLGREILSIALPAALGLAADPITGLVDTAFVGHLGSVELAAVGVSISVFNLVSKLFNVPLLNITTSFVAEEQAVLSQDKEDSIRINQDFVAEKQEKKLLPSVSTSLALAAGIGIAETVLLSAGSGFIMNIMGIPVESPMRVPAEHFLSMRAFGAPPVVIALAAQGTFRGFKDTKTPLYAIGNILHYLHHQKGDGDHECACFFREQHVDGPVDRAGNLLNAILDPILIFLCGLGIGGAAISTVISEYLIAFVLLWELNGKIQLISPKIDGGKMVQYLKSGGLLIARTLAVLVTMTLATSMAAREGPVPMAGHQICLQIWLTVSLLTDALALAGQALLASGYSAGNYGQAREVVFRVLKIGLLTGTGLSVILFLGFDTFSTLFTTETEVLKIAWSGILFVAGSQPLNAIAFVIDGLYYGVSDFAYAAYSMMFVGFISSLYILVAAPAFGLAGVEHEEWAMEINLVWERAGERVGSTRVIT
ncbi:Multi antimicrobial extrusion protein [Dillenia turbinata]|uniref:Protein DETOXIFICATION n=1 Tax=Dillenia turbinata TaxID=194707 RepID=A0AAN8VZW0_9MAGN